MVKTRFIWCMIPDGAEAGEKRCLSSLHGGIILKNTLSDNGGVTRGICHTDSRGDLTDVGETRILSKHRREPLSWKRTEV